MRDILNSNLNSMLEKAEDPEKLVKLMIMEMEDTLVEVKASAAAVMADRQKASREAEACRDRSQGWQAKAKLAISKKREDLAKEALMEKKFYLKQAEAREREAVELEALIEQYADQIRQLEEKLAEAREKHRVLVKRHIHAREKKRVQKQIRKADSSDAFVRFERLQHRVDRMEAEADLVNFGRRPTLDEQFEIMQEEEEIERELRELKSQGGKPPKAEELGSSA
jgi:phage shock protein A